MRLLTRDIRQPTTSEGDNGNATTTARRQGLGQHQQTSDTTMAPSKHPMKTKEEGRQQNNYLLFDFYKHRRKGGPKKKGNLARDCIIITKQGPVASVNNPPGMHDASKRKAPPFRVLHVKKEQANYSSGEGLEKLTAVINEWNAGIGRALDSNGVKHGIVQVTNMVGIPSDTFRKYVHPDPEKRQEVGKSAARASLLMKGNQGFCLDALACLDRGSDGSDLPRAIHLVQDIKP
jgi:hypothetical protein